jgi:protease-4
MSQPVDGEGRTLEELIGQQLERVAADDRVKAVILKVDSPGGEVLASDEIYNRLWDFQEDHPEIPVVVSMGSLAASGGYYVSAPCQWIVANELTMTGSIGVIFHSYNYRGLMDKVGVRPAITKSGKLKDMMSGEKAPGEELPEEREILQSMIDESFGRFKQVIRAGRQRAAERNAGDGTALAEDWESIADGRILSGKAAMEKGLVDELGNVVDMAMMPMYLLSGVMFPLAAVPYPYREWLLLNPVAHGLEGLRLAFAPHYHAVPELSMAYLYAFALAVVFMGLALHVRYQNRLVAQ